MLVRVRKRERITFSIIISNNFHQAVAPLVVRPYLSDLTVSELHCVMTSGFATVAGTALAAYISFGVSAAHLLSASVMSAPAALAFAKLMHPETEESKDEGKDINVQTLGVEEGEEGKNWKSFQATHFTLFLYSRLQAQPS